jgi:2-C-methyl-D-erythritol 4-phosphate cytidylyltransferase / 2-C-methyl-D-erythritol 2,4-cyclodiphosphate synthase
LQVAAIIAAGGRGTRFGGDRPKQLLTLAGRPILERSIDAFVRSPLVHEIVVAVPADLIVALPDYLQQADRRIEVVAGGPRRQDSVANAFARVADRADVVIVHDAARPLVSGDLIRRTIEGAVETGAAIAAVRSRDTVKRGDASGLVMATLPRDEIFLAQTPQAFRTSVLRDALAVAEQVGAASDEAMLAERAGYRVKLVAGDPRNLKITTPEDLAIAEQLLRGGAARTMMRIGNGYDLHRLVDGRRLVLGGVTIPFEKGLQGHSDADAVCHAITDAILGAAGAGDIGRHFPDTDPAWKDANSIRLLGLAGDVIRNAGFTIVNVDVVVIAQRPKLLPHVDAMRQNVARALAIAPDQVSVKGKTNEGVDSMGTGESIAVHAVALLKRGSEVI